MELFIKAVLVFGSIGHLLLIVQNVTLLSDMFSTGESAI